MPLRRFPFHNLQKKTAAPCYKTTSKQVTATTCWYEENNFSGNSYQRTQTLKKKSQNQNLRATRK